MTDDELAECAAMLARYARLIPWGEDRAVLHGLAECTDHLLNEVRRLRAALAASEEQAQDLYSEAVRASEY